MNLTDDDELRLSIKALREHDAAQTPAFETTWQRAVSASRPSRLKRVSLMIGAGLAATYVLVAFGLRIGAPAIASRSTVPARDTTRLTIHTWRSPTASLLRTPSSALLAPQPILSSVLDDAARLSIQQKGGSE